MFAKAASILAGVVALAQAQTYWYIPPDPTGFFCDGISRPDWDECEAHYIDDFFSTEMTIGPEFLVGQVFTYENCQVRYIQCSGSGNGFTMDEELGLFTVVKNSCKRLGGGGVRRQAEVCIVVEDPKNPYTPFEVGP